MKIFSSNYRLSGKTLKLQGMYDRLHGLWNRDGFSCLLGRLKAGEEISPCIKTVDD